MKRFGTHFLRLLVVFLIYLGVSIVLFYPRWSNLTTHYGTPDFDTDGTIWYQWARIFTEQQGINFTYTNELVAYPFGYDVSYIPYFSLIYELNLQAMKALGGDWSAIITVANVSTLLSFPLSALTAFMLTFYLTRKTYGSFLSGLIFSFSYYHVLMTGGSLSLNHIEFIPLFYLTFLNFLDKPNWKSLLLSSLAFVVLFMSNAYWAFFSIVITPVFFLFYGPLSLKKRVQLFFIYYPSVVIATIFTNLNYIYSQLYNLSPYQLLYVFPKTGSVQDQLLNTLAFYSPSTSALFKPWFYSKGEHTLGYLALTISFLGFFVVKKHKNYAIFLAALLLTILIASKVSPFLMLNELYFQYFRAFRAVSRLVILASLFVGVLTAFSVENIRPYVEKFFPTRLRKGGIIVLAVLMPIVILLEGITVSPLSRRITNFQQIVDLYQPLRDDDSVRRIVGYPLEITGEDDGFPHNYEVIGQVVHQKTLVGGLSRFNSQARGYREQIKNLSDPRTIERLTEKNVDTILIYMNMYGNATEDMETLLNDSRVEYVGTLEKDKDPNTYVSANDMSRKIAVFRITSVVEANKQSSTQEELTTSLPTEQYTIEKLSATEYNVRLKNINEPFTLKFDEPFSAKWQLFVPESNSAVFVSNHLRADESVNAWHILLEDIQELPKTAYIQNADGSYDLNLTLFFTPARLEQDSERVRWLFISAVLLLIFGNLLYLFYKKRYQTTTQPKTS